MRNIGAHIHVCVDMCVYVYRYTYVCALPTQSTEVGVLSEFQELWTVLQSEPQNSLCSRVNPKNRALPVGPWEPFTVLQSDPKNHLVHVLRAGYAENQNGEITFWDFVS